MLPLRLVKPSYLRWLRGRHMSAVSTRRWSGLRVSCSFALRRACGKGLYLKRRRSPDDVVDFLVHRCLKGDGRTMVHLPSCTTRGKRHGSCDCPKRMGQSAACALASKVRTRFAELGCAGPWSSQSFSGNPADSALVHRYTAAVKEEQAMAGCVSVTARQRAMLPDKLRELVRRLRRQAYAAFPTDKVKWVRLLQDIAWLTIQFRSLNRGAELSGLRTAEAVLGPNDSCIAFQVSFGKTLRGGNVSHEFGVPQPPGDGACPVRAFRQYTSETRTLFQWTWDSGSFPVFPYIGPEGRRRETAVTAAAMAQRFRSHLRSCFSGDWESTEILESLHGLRAGGALNMALEGSSLRDIMAQGFWASPKTALHYVGMLCELIGPEFEDAVRDRGGLLSMGNYKRSFDMMHGV